MTATILAPATAGHTHRFIMETAEAAMQRQPDIAHGERTVLGSCRCGASTQAKAVIGANTSFGNEVSDGLAA